MNKVVVILAICILGISFEASARHGHHHNHWRDHHRDGVYMRYNPNYNYDYNCFYDRFGRTICTENRIEYRDRPGLVEKILDDLI